MINVIPNQLCYTVGTQTIGFCQVRVS